MAPPYGDLLHVTVCCISTEFHQWEGPTKYMLNRLYQSWTKPEPFPGEGLHVSCKEGYLLPSPHKTPLTYVCDSSGQFNPPSCQGK